MLFGRKIDVSLHQLSSNSLSVTSFDIVRQYSGEFKGDLELDFKLFFLC